MGTPFNLAHPMLWGQGEAISFVRCKSMIPKKPTQSEIRALLDELRSDNALGLKQTDNKNEYLQYLDSKEWKKMSTVASKKNALTICIDQYLHFRILSFYLVPK